MKVVVDACVWSLMLRRNEVDLSAEERSLRATLIDLIRDSRVAMIGPIRQEVLSGIKLQAHYEKLRMHLGAFADEPLTTTHYEEAARLFNLCRSRGVCYGATDILLCAVAAEMTWSILTNDQGLLRCMAVLRSEGISI